MIDPVSGFIIEGETLNCEDSGFSKDNKGVWRETDKQEWLKVYQTYTQERLKTRPRLLNITGTLGKDLIVGRDGIKRAAGRTRRKVLVNVPKVDRRHSERSQVKLSEDVDVGDQGQMRIQSYLPEDHDERNGDFNRNCDIDSEESFLEIDLDKKKTTSKKRYGKRKEKEKDRFKCSQCSLRFRYDYKRTQHLIVDHKDESKLFQCEFCPKVFMTVHWLTKHMNCVHPKELYS